MRRKRHFTIWLLKISRNVFLAPLIQNLVNNNQHQRKQNQYHPINSYLRSRQSNFSAYPFYFRSLIAINCGFWGGDLRCVTLFASLFPLQPVQK